MNQTKTKFLFLSLIFFINSVTIPRTADFSEINEKFPKLEENIVVGNAGQELIGNAYDSSQGDED
jgi:hypothetical protein